MLQSAEIGFLELLTFIEATDNLVGKDLTNGGILCVTKILMICGQKNAVCVCN